MTVPHKLAPPSPADAGGAPADPKIFPRHARLFRHIGKGAVPVVLVQSIAQRLCGLKEISRTAIYKIQIHPTVVVVVEYGDSGAHGFGQVAEGRDRIIVLPGDSCFLGWPCLEILLL